MRQNLLEYYERELGYLRQMGAEFAAKYPAVAGRLLLEPDRCSDPHVERLIESFSFLAARIHLRLDDDLPELTEGFLDAVYPHYLRPVPAMTVVEFSPEEGASNTSHVTQVHSGSELTAKRARNGVLCKFRTSYPVQLQPFEVEQCTWRRPEQIASPPRVQDAVAVLRVTLKGHRDVVLAKLALDRISWYLSGERSVALTLYELLSSKVTRILVRNPDRKESKLAELSAFRLRPMGFTPDEALLPYTRRSFQGYRLLQEYFSLPEKFLFFELEGLGGALESVEAGERVELLIYVSQFEQPERMPILENGVSAETLKLRCTPVINLFTHVAEPVILSQTRHEYPITVNARNRAGYEIFSIDSVLATNPARRTSTPLPSLYEQRFGTPTSNARVFWRSTRRQSPIDDRRPSDMYLSVVDRAGIMIEPDAEILSVRCTSTNHDLPSQLPFGNVDGDFYLEGDSAAGQIRALHRPTPTYAAPAGSKQVWSLLSQLSLNHLSLGEAGLPALQEILRLHNFADAPQHEKQVSGIVSMGSSRHVALMQSEFGSVAARGMRVELELDESHFPSGGAYLFGAVLDHFFGLYVSMNSFSQLTVRTRQRKGALCTCLPRAGSEVLM